MFGAAIAFLTFITFVAVLVGAVIATGLNATSSGTRWPAIAGTMVLIFVGLRIVKRGLRRTWGPVRSLIDTAGRLADGQGGAGSG